MPISNSQLTRCISRPPEGYNLLVAPISLLLERFNVNLKKGFEKTGKHGCRWVLTGKPFISVNCDCEKVMCWKNRLQQVKPVNTLKRRNSVTALLGLPFTNTSTSTISDTPLAIPLNGAICFGKISDVLAIGVE